MAEIRVGIGGWTFPPWRGRFYPPGLVQSQELRFASGRLTAIEVNATFYRTQSPQSFARWAAETPKNFVFAVKAPRAATYRADPVMAAESIERFVGAGLAELGGKLGPILWQLPSTRRFDPTTMQQFVSLLPDRLGGLALRHVIEAAHPSFADPAWIALLRQRGIAAAIVEREEAPQADLTADFVYLRLERNDAAEPQGYAETSLSAWAGRLQGWAAGRQVTDLPTIAPPTPGRQNPRDCYAFFISGDKQSAPLAAQAMLARLAA